MQFLSFPEFKQIPGFVHGISTRWPEGWNEDQMQKSAGINLEIPSSGLLFLNQVHSSNVAVLDGLPLQKTDSGSILRTDGIVVLEHKVYPVVRSADCVPILLVAPRRKAFALLHAGWRGTLERIAVKGVQALSEKTGDPGSEILAAIGPCIRECCYEVGADVRGEFVDRSFDLSQIFSGRNLNLAAANKQQLRDTGVETILDINLCTACRTDLFYSYRKEKTSSRIWTVAGFY